ncbi:MAG: alpha/beta hydrolase [Alphaproteobacteria bacterium HGW-Alphaproteobacteria-6]|nr:MAG: alpha/beta hydrolase [Alphaproteobacteria bacterium HGW-Alphaproteobacteria-6]
MTQSFATSDCITLSLHQTGTGRAMVFQHGLCGDANQPAQVFPPDTGYRCVTLECRGHGASQAGPVDRLSIATFADDIARMMVVNGLGPAVVGGISMGAAIALRLAITRPELVSALVLARPAWVADAAPANMAPNALVGDLLRDHAAEKARILFEETATAAQLATIAPDNLASLRGFFSRHPVAVTAGLLCRISADGPGVSEADIAGIGVPILVIGHAQDFVHPLDHARRLAHLIPNARLTEITPKAEDPAAYQRDFRAALATFLKGL